MRQIKIQKPQYSPKVQEYKEKFGHPPSAEAQKWKTKAELESLAEMALKRGRPVKSWAERPSNLTGTVTDGWYAQKTSPSSER